jgi:hypothetical protein
MVPKLHRERSATQPNDDAVGAAKARARHFVIRNSGFDAPDLRFA